jgi:hypothetical protein
MSCHWLAEFHPELNAIIEANEVVAWLSYFRSDSKQRGYFEDAELSQAPSQLILFVALWLDIVAETWIQLILKRDSFYSIVFIVDSNCSNAAKTTTAYLLFLNFLIVIVRISIEV